MKIFELRVLLQKAYDLGKNKEKLEYLEDLIRDIEIK